MTGHRALALRVLPLLILALLFVGCGRQGASDDGSSDSLFEISDGGLAPGYQEQEPAYETHVLAYGNALTGVDQDVLDNFDTIILEAQVLENLEPHHRNKAVLYFNAWAKSTWLDDTRPWQEWQPVLH